MKVNFLIKEEVSLFHCRLKKELKYINSLKEKDIREYTKFSLINQYDKFFPEPEYMLLI